MIAAAVAALVMVGVSSAGAPACPCVGDADGDGRVNFDDLTDLLELWGDCPEPCLPACGPDFNGDCRVDFDDLVELLDAWGECESIVNEPGPSIPQATNLGVLNASGLQVCEYIGANDWDVYRFQLNQAAAVSATLTDRVSGIQSWLVADSNGDGVFASSEDLSSGSSSGSGDVALAADLVPGVYYIWIQPWTTGYTRYSLSLQMTALEALPTDPGATLPTSRNLGNATNMTLAATDLVGGHDTRDVYRFSLNATRAVTVTVTGRTEGLECWLIADVNGDDLAGTSEDLVYAGNSGSADLALAEDLVPGDYHLIMETWDNDDTTRYTVTINAAPLPSNTIDPAGTLAGARNLGTLNDNGLHTEDVVGGFDPVDVYRFTLNQARAVTLTVTGRTEGLDCWLVADVNGDGLFGNSDGLVYAGNSGNADLTLAEDLVPGTYYIYMEPWDLDDSTRYTLDVTSVLLPATPADAGSTMATARHLGTINNSVEMVADVVGGYDAVDVYSFDLAANRAVTATVTGRTEGMECRLYADVDNDGLFDGTDELVYAGNSGVTDLQLAEDLVPGRYFLLLDPWDLDDSSRYTLTVSSTLLPDVSPEPGSAFLTAHDLGMIQTPAGRTVSDVVGGYDNVDTYRFAAGSDGMFTATLTGRTEGMLVWLVRDIDQDGLFDGNESLDSASSSGVTDLAVQGALLAGETYYLVIRGSNDAASTRYTLQVFRP